MQTTAQAPIVNGAAVQVNNLSKLYGSYAALRRVSCTFAAGGLHVLLGSNGAGKSTLLRVLAGLTSPTSGTALVLGVTPDTARTRTGYMSHASMLYDDLSPMENLRYFAGLHCPADTCGCTSSPERALRSVGIDPALTRTAGQLSQGMRQRVSLARVLLTDPQVLLLDEPFSNLDVDGAHELVKLLVDFCRWPGRDGAGARTVIVTTHQRELVLPVAASSVTLKNGAVVEPISEVEP